MPAPPPTCDYTKPAEAALSKIYENDKLGDCVIAGMAHVVGVLTGGAGPKPFLYSDAEIIKLYSAIGGYVPGDPATDQGCDEQTALNYWENNGALPPHTTSPTGAHKDRRLDDGRFSKCGRMSNSLVAVREFVLRA